MSPLTWVAPTIVVKTAGCMPVKLAVTLPSGPMVTLTPDPPSSVRLAPATVAVDDTPVVLQDPTGQGGTVGVGVGVADGPEPGVPVVQAAAPTRSAPAKRSGTCRGNFIVVSVRVVPCHPLVIRLGGGLTLSVRTV